MALPKPWDRMSGETDPAFAAFQAYLAMGLVRTLKKVGEECGKNGSLIERWSARWGWVGRARSYDAEHARIEAKRREKASQARADRRRTRWATREEEVDEIAYQSLLQVRHILKDLADQRIRSKTEASVKAPTIAEVKPVVLLIAELHPMALDAVKRNNPKFEHGLDGNGISAETIDPELVRKWAAVTAEHFGMRETAEERAFQEQERSWHNEYRRHNGMPEIPDSRKPWPKSS